MFVNSFVFFVFLYFVSPKPSDTEMDFEFLNSSTLSSLGYESTTTEKPNSDILNDTIKTFQKVIYDKDMVS